MPIEKRWVVKPQGDPATVAMLAAALRTSPILANLLVQRGIDTVEKAEKFFKPSLADLHDPFLMKDMDKAVERVERAVADNEKIMVYGDYDVDGCTAGLQVPAPDRAQKPDVLHPGPLYRRVWHLGQGH